MNLLTAGLNIYTHFFKILWCNAHAKPGRRRQRLILLTEAIMQVIFKKGKKKTRGYRNVKMSYKKLW